MVFACTLYSFQNKSSENCRNLEWFLSLKRLPCALTCSGSTVSHREGANATGGAVLLSLSDAGVVSTIGSPSKSSSTKEPIKNIRCVPIKKYATGLGVMRRKTLVTYWGYRPHRRLRQPALHPPVSRALLPGFPPAVSRQTGSHRSLPPPPGRGKCFAAWWGTLADTMPSLPMRGNSSSHVAAKTTPGKMRTKIYKTLDTHSKQLQPSNQSTYRESFTVYRTFRILDELIENN